MPLFWIGRRLATRIWVCDCNGRCLYHVTSERAFRLLEQQQFSIFDDCGKIWRLLPKATPGPIRQEAHRLTARDFGTKPSVIKRRLGPKDAFAGLRTYEHIKRSKLDRWAFVLSVTENLYKPSCTDGRDDQ